MKQSISILAAMILLSSSESYAGGAPDQSTVILPFDSSMRISLECRNWGLSGAMMVATDSGAWHIFEEVDSSSSFIRFRSKTADNNASDIPLF